MHLDTTVELVQRQLASAASLGDERTQQIAQALAEALDSGIRLALVRAVSEFADEATAALLDSPGSPRIAACVDGDDITVEVTAGASTPDDVAAEPTDAGEANARISLRLTDALKKSIDEAAARDGVSVNTWLVRAAGAALHTPKHHGQRSNTRLTGWVTG